MASAAQRGVHAGLPLLQHPLSNPGKPGMFLRIGTDFLGGILNRFTLHLSIGQAY